MIHLADESVKIWKDCVREKSNETFFRIVEGRFIDPPFTGFSMANFRWKKQNEMPAWINCCGWWLSLMSSMGTSVIIFTCALLLILLAFRQLRFVTITRSLAGVSTSVVDSSMREGGGDGMVLFPRYVQVGDRHANLVAQRMMFLFIEKRCSAGLIELEHSEKVSWSDVKAVGLPTYDAHSCLLHTVWMKDDYAQLPPLSTLSWAPCWMKT